MNFVSFVLTGLVSSLKFIVLKLASEKFITWSLLWVAEIAVESTKTKKDDAWFAKAKEVINS